MKLLEFSYVAVVKIALQSGKHCIPEVMSEENIIHPDGLEVVAVTSKASCGRTSLE